jgi:plastocyanin
MKRRTYLAALGASGVTGLSGCTGLLGGGSPCEDGDCDVGMTGNSFVPRDIQVEVGETVRWRNTSARAHTVTAYESSLPDGAAFFASGGFETEDAALDAWSKGRGGLEGGDTYEHTFEVAGDYQYYCIPHEAAEMIGTVAVVE